MTLRSFNLAQIERADAFDQLDRRERDMVNIRGFKICVHFRNKSTAVPFYLHVAVVCPKSTLVVNTGDFLRGHGAVDKNLDLTTAVTSSLQTWCNGINTDLYTILMHKRYILKYNSQDAGTWGGKSKSTNIVHFQKYMKFKKQLRYDGANNTPEADNPFLLFWYDIAERPLGVTAGSAPDLVFSQHIVTYFREPRY